MMNEIQYAVFARKAIDVNELVEQANSPAAKQAQCRFTVEKLVLLSDAAYTLFCRKGFMQDQGFLMENTKSMWFDAKNQCWHCLLVKGEHSPDGVLVESEGYSYARYTAHVSDCAALCLNDVPVQYVCLQQSHHQGKRKGKELQR